MTAHFTALATGPAESRVAADLQRIVECVRALVPEDACVALALIGGFGRGEGGVLQLPSGEIRAFNDYDLVLLVRSPVEEGALRSALLRLARDLEIDFIDLGVVTPRHLAVAPATVFWYELREGHRVLLGDPHAFAALGPRDPARLPLEEATRLLTNRGLALLWARLDLDAADLAGGTLTDERRRFVVNATHKAVMAMGDAVLLQVGQYHLSYPERVRRLARVDIPFAAGAPAAWSGAPDPGEFRRAHAAATQFKLFPEIPADTGTQLLAWWTTVRDWHERALLWVESLRLGRRLEDWCEYPARLGWESLREGLRHPRGYLRERRPTPDLKGWSRHWLDRERSFRARLPILLYGSPPSRLASAGPASRSPGAAGGNLALLGAGLSDVPTDPPARLERWRRASWRLLQEWHP